MEATGDALMAVSIPEGRVSFVNSAFAGMTGFTRDEIEGESVTMLNSHSSTEPMRERPIDFDMLKTPGFYNDIALVTRDGQIRFVTMKVRHTELKGHTVALAVISDDTERQLLLRDLTVKHQSLETAYQELEGIHSELKVTQEKMLQASKLVALGELASGMSHELNQPLTGIRGFAQEINDLLRTQPKPSKKQIRQLAQWIMTNSDKMASLLSHLRKFARQGREEAAADAPPVAVALTEVVHSVQVLLARQLEKQNVILEVRNIHDQLQTWGRAHPIEQILINLVTNSRDAVLEQKRNNPSHKGKILVTAGEMANHTWLRVTDNGCGMSDSVRARIFDPFFSTKETGQGMGLGLSISFGLAHKLGGELSLESTSATGTTFLLKLPRVPGKSDRKAA